MSKDVDRNQVLQTTRVRTALKNDGSWIHKSKRGQDTARTESAVETTPSPEKPKTYVLSAAKKFESVESQLNPLQKTQFASPEGVSAKKLNGDAQQELVANTSVDNKKEHVVTPLGQLNVEYKKAKVSEQGNVEDPDAEISLGAAVGECKDTSTVDLKSKNKPSTITESENARDEEKSPAQHANESCKIFAPKQIAAETAGVVVKSSHETPIVNNAAPEGNPALQHRVKAVNDSPTPSATNTAVKSAESKTKSAAPTEIVLRITATSPEPAADAPASAAGSVAPVQQKLSDAPASGAGSAASVHQKLSDAPAPRVGSTAPVQQKLLDVPASGAGSAAPVQQKQLDAPVSGGGSAAHVQPKQLDAPVSGEGSAALDAPVSGGGSAAPIQQNLLDAPSSGAGSVAPIQQKLLDTSGAGSIAPVQQKLLDALFSGSAGSAATDAPVSGGGSEAPIQQKLLDAPASEKGSAAPTQQKPLNVPSSGAGSVAPVQQKPLNTPSSEAGSVAPVQQKLSDAPASGAGSAASVHQKLSDAPAPRVGSTAPVQQKLLDAPASGACSAALIQQKLLDASASEKGSAAPAKQKPLNALSSGAGSVAPVQQKPLNTLSSEAGSVAPVQQKLSDAPAPRVGSTAPVQQKLLDAPASGACSAAPIQQKLLDAPASGADSLALQQKVPNVPENTVAKQRLKTVLESESEHVRNLSIKDASTSAADQEAGSAAPVKQNLTDPPASTAAPESYQAIELTDALDVTPPTAEVSPKPVNDPKKGHLERPKVNQSDDTNMSEKFQKPKKELQPTCTVKKTRDGKAVCSYCDQVIIGNVKITVSEPQMTCHEYCLKCGVCAKALGDLVTPIFLHDQVIHCDGCFEKALRA